MRGFNGYKDGVAFTDCPYKEGSHNWMYWTMGWLKSKELSK